jgi:hypothetical protein
MEPSGRVGHGGVSSKESVGPQPLPGIILLLGHGERPALHYTPCHEELLHPRQWGLERGLKPPN